MKELTDQEQRALIFGSMALRDQSEKEAGYTATRECDPDFWAQASAESFENAKILRRLACPNTWEESQGSWLAQYRWHALIRIQPRVIPFTIEVEFSYTQDDLDALLNQERI